LKPNKYRRAATRFRATADKRRQTRSYAARIPGVPPITRKRNRG